MKTISNNEVLQVVGLNRLTSTNSRYFKELVNAVLGDNQRVVEVDCSEVKFMDSEGIGALVSIYKRLAPRNGVIRLKQVQPLIRQLLELLKFHQLFEITD